METEMETVRAFAWAGAIDDANVNRLLGVVNG